MAHKRAVYCIDDYAYMYNLYVSNCQQLKNTKAINISPSEPQGSVTSACSYFNEGSMRERARGGGWVENRRDEVSESGNVGERGGRGEGNGKVQGEGKGEEE